MRTISSQGRPGELWAGTRRVNRWRVSRGDTPLFGNHACTHLRAMTPTPDTDLAAVRRVDPDRFLCAVFAPAGLRDAAFALIGFNHELVRAVEMPSARSGAGPIATLIRLQWWREVVLGERRDAGSHPVATALRAMIEREAVAVATLEGMVAAREAEAEGDLTMETWREMMLQGPGGLQRALGELLQVPSGLLLRIAAVGAAHGCAGLRRRLGGMPGRCLLPESMLAEAGLDRNLLPQASAAQLVPLAALLAREGAGFLDIAGQLRLPREQMTAALPLALACRDLGAPPTQGDRRGVGDRMAVLGAFLLGRAGRPSAAAHAAGSAEAEDHQLVN